MTLPAESPYAKDLGKNAANYVPLTPLTYLERSAAIWPDRVAVVHGPVRRTWAETAARCRRLASALAKLGLAKGDTVAVLAANTPELFEAHFGRTPSTRASTPKPWPSSWRTANLAS
jgi:fatty-acyl-CoA synthase